MVNAEKLFIFFTKILRMKSSHAVAQNTLVRIAQSLLGTIGKKIL